MTINKIKKQNIKTIIFDFDGTIADTLPYTFEKIIEISKKYKIKNNQIIEKIKTISPKELFKEFKISWFKIPLIIWEIKKTQKQLYFDLDKIKIFPGIKELLKNLKQRNIKIFIYSSNIKKNIDYFLKKEKIEECFDKIYVGKNLLGKDKDLFYILKKENLKKEEVFYVADEIRDVLACKRAKIKMVGVLWGLAGKEGFKKFTPDFLIKKPQQLLKLLI
ncbi:MAG: HAD-IA family hydrolase [Patescibacteria group bacterium]|nr:HAD-IA family hydrolase [Patescibacteria group bacterium]